MVKEKTIIKIILILLAIIIIGVLLYFVLDSDIRSDEKRFKTEYEELNGLKNDNNKNYVKVKIPRKNNVKYASFNEVMDFLEDGTGILYLGFPECPWCRNMVPILIDTALENEIENLYYFNAL